MHFSLGHQLPNQIKLLVMSRFKKDHQFPLFSFLVTLLQMTESFCWICLQFTVQKILSLVTNTIYMIFSGQYKNNILFHQDIQFLSTQYFLDEIKHL